MELVIFGSIMGWVLVALLLAAAFAPTRAYDLLALSFWRLLAAVLFAVLIGATTLMDLLPRNLALDVVFRITAMSTLAALLIGLVVFCTTRKPQPAATPPVNGSAGMKLTTKIVIRPPR